MINKYILLISAFVVLLQSCDSETELKRSVFIPDTDFPGLPAYSEWGYNTFGAYYDRAPFTSKDFSVPSKVIVENGTVTFSLEGLVREDNASTLPLEIEFDLPGLTLTSYEDLIALHQQTFDLTQIPVRIVGEGDIVEMEIEEGELSFVRAQNLWLDGEKVHVILSGRFEFTGRVGTEPITVSEGRFDLGMGADNFFD